MANWVRSSQLVSTLDFDINTEPRRGIGWILFWTIAGILIVTQAAEYLSRPREALPYSQYDQLLRATVVQREGQAALKALSGLNDDAVNPGRSYEDAVSDLAALRSTDVRAARLYAAMRTELDEPVTQEDVAILVKSDKPEDRAFAELYTGTELSKEHVDRLVRSLPDGSPQFVWTAAKIHGLERADDKGARRRYIPPTEFYGFLIGVGIVTFAFCAGALLWPIYFILRRSGKLEPLGHPSGMLPPADSDRYAFRVAQILIALTLVPMILGSLLRWDSRVMSAVGAMTVLATVLVLLSLPLFGKKISVHLIGLHGRDFFKNVAWGFLAAIANVPMLLILSVLGSSLFRNLPEAQHPVSFQLQGDQATLTVLTFLFIASITAPLIEEITFRGHLLPAMSSVFRSVPLGIAASSLIFAAIHPTGIPAWLPLAWIGAMGAMLTYQTRSLVPAIVLHAVHNFSTLALVVLLF